MIEVTRLDDSKIMVNVELIQSLQATPDTVITFTSKDRIMVKEAVEEIRRRIFEYQFSIHMGVHYLFQDEKQTHPNITLHERYQRLESRE